MKLIQFFDPHRRKHFEFFKAMSYPHFQITSNVPITEFQRVVRKENFHFTSAIVFLLTKAAIEIPNFKWRIRGDQVIEHDTLDPSFAVHTDASEVFSFCTVEYDANWHIFQLRSKTQIENMRLDPSFEDEQGKDDFLFMSSVPWVHFTGIQHPVSMPADSIPRITWGKIENKSNGQMMPLSVQAHHGLVDGRDMGLYFQKVQSYAADPNSLFGI